MNKVVSKRNGGTGLYVGRPTKYGNPFVAGRDGTRHDVVTQYAHWAELALTDQDIRDLIGHDLVCWCAPLECHADVLLAWADALHREDNS